jgi:hypothetical protein
MVCTLVHSIRIYDIANTFEQQKSKKPQSYPQSLPFKVSQQRTASAKSYDRAQHLPSIANILVCQKREEEMRQYTHCESLATSAADTYSTLGHS